MVRGNVCVCVDVKAASPPKKKKKSFCAECRGHGRTETQRDRGLL